MVQRRLHHRLELSDDSETSESVFLSRSETFLVSSSQTPRALDKAAPPEEPMALQKRRSNLLKSGTVEEHENVVAEEVGKPHPLNSLLNRQLSIMSNPEAISETKVDHNSKRHLSETSHGHLTNPVGIVRSLNRDRPPIPNSHLKQKFRPKTETLGENRQNHRMLAFKLPKPFGFNRTSQVHPETVDEDHQELSCSVPNTLRKDTLTLGGSPLPTPVMRLSPLLSSSIRLGGCFSGRQLFTPEDHLESCFSDRHVRVFIMTWNMQEIKVRSTLAWEWGERERSQAHNYMDVGMGRRKTLGEGHIPSTALAWERGEGGHL